MALLLALFVGIVSPFLVSHQVGALYERRGQVKPVNALTGLWMLLLGACPPGERALLRKGALACNKP